MSESRKHRILEHPDLLPAGHLQSIGEIAYRWNMIELYMQSITWHVLGLDLKKGRLLTYWPGQQAKIKAFKALTERWVTDEVIASKLKRIYKAANKLQPRRNNVVHGIWGFEKDSPNVLELIELESAADRVMPRAKVYGESELSSLASSMRKTQQELYELHAEIGAPLP